MKKPIMLLALFFLVLASSVSAIGITHPSPQNIELAPGQSSYFTFQIQSDNFPLVCAPLVEDLQGLEIAFNPQYEVEANQRYNVKPQVIIPKQTPYGNYKITFCIECRPIGEIEGSMLIPRICNLPLTLNVVAERTRKNIFDEERISLWITLLIIAIIILAIIILLLTIHYVIKRRRQQRQQAKAK